MYPLLETIKAQNGKIQNLNFHQKRLDRSFQKYYEKQNKFNLSKILNNLQLPADKTLKIRFLYSENDFDIQIQPYKIKKINKLKLVNNNTIDYSLKYTDRKIFEIMKKNIAPDEDILIVKNGLITDTSFSNIVFFDGKQWITPSTPLLNGTYREKLLYEKKIFEAIIKPSDLYKFTHFKLINAMLEWEFEPKEIKYTNIRKYF